MVAMHTGNPHARIGSICLQATSVIGMPRNTIQLEQNIEVASRHYALDRVVRYEAIEMDHVFHKLCYRVRWSVLEEIHNLAIALTDQELLLGEALSLSFHENPP